MLSRAAAHVAGRGAAKALTQPKKKNKKKRSRRLTLPPWFGETYMTSFTPLPRTIQAMCRMASSATSGASRNTKSKGSIIKVRAPTPRMKKPRCSIIGGVALQAEEGSRRRGVSAVVVSDTTLKVAILTIPHDKQRRWPEGEGGVQHPTDDEFALDFSDKLAHITKNKFAVGEKGEFEIKGDKVYFRGKKLIVDGELIVNKLIKTPQIVTGQREAARLRGQQAGRKRSPGGGGGGSTPAQFELDFGDAESTILP